MRSFAVAVGLAALVLAAPPARSDGEHAAPDVVVLCEPTLAGALTRVGRMWREKTGVPVRVFASPTRLLLEQAAHRPRSDLLVAEGEDAAQAAEQRQLIKPGTRRPLGGNSLVLASSAEASAGAAASFDPATLRGAAVAIVEAADDPAAEASRKALEAAGLWDGIKDSVVGVHDTGDAAFLVESRAAAFAVLYATDVDPNPRLKRRGTFPAATYPPIRYWVAQTATALSPNAATFADFLQGPEAQQQLRSDGLEAAR